MTEERAPYFLVHPTPEDEIEFTIANYVCGTCMGELVLLFEGGRWYVICEKCGENTREYISRHYKS